MNRTYKKKTRVFRRRAGRRILQSTAMLPALFTILNGLCGFGSIHFATKDALGAAQMSHLVLAAWLIFAAMVCDMLDGRLARLTRRTSDFGAQLDSMCDMVSFGVAPAALMLRTVITVMQGQIERLSYLDSHIFFERVIWCIAAIYVACSALRLARFNVETESDESSHMSFRGLPTPGAAAAIASLVLLFAHLVATEAGWESAQWLLVVVGLTLPTVTLAGAFLMVSRLRYPHMVNQYIRGRRPFSYLVKIVILILALFLLPYQTLAAGTIAFVSLGPVRAVVGMLRHRSEPGPEVAPAEIDS